MSNGTVNKILVIGFVGNDPVFKKTDLFSVCNLNLATSEKVKGAYETEWHKCIFYNKLAEIANSYVKKGDKIYVSGKVKTREWKDKEGNIHRVNEILANEMTILSSKHEVKEDDEQEKLDFSQDIPF